MKRLRPTAQRPYTPIPGYPGYSLSADFQIIGKKGKPLALKKTQCGKYQFCCVGVPRVSARNGTWLYNTTLYLHRAIAFVHVDGYFTGATVDHVDGNPLNNDPSNLEWVTMAVNSYRAWERVYAKGGMPFGYGFKNGPTTTWSARLGLTEKEYMSTPRVARRKLRNDWLHALRKADAQQPARVS